MTKGKQMPLNTAEVCVQTVSLFNLSQLLW